MAEPSNTDLALALHAKGVVWWPLDEDDTHDCLIAESIDRRDMNTIVWAAAVALNGVGWLPRAGNTSWYGHNRTIIEDPRPIRATLLAACAMEGVDP